MVLGERKSTFYTALRGAPRNYSDYSSGTDDGYILFEHQLNDGISHLTADRIEEILEGEVSLPLFLTVEATTAYIQAGLDNGDGLMAAEIRKGELMDTAYMVESNELEGFMTFPQSIETF